MTHHVTTVEYFFEKQIKMELIIHCYEKNEKVISEKQQFVYMMTAFKVLLN